MRTTIFVFGVLAALAVPVSAQAKTITVGSGKQFATVTAALNTAVPGDVVEVYAGTYAGDMMIRKSGTAAAPITIRGIVANGQRPRISGGENTVVLNANNIVFENFDVTGGTSICIVHKGDNITVRNAVVHDCPTHGILGTDEESGSLTVEYTEVHHCGGGERHHQLYIATDQVMYPGSVFRLQHSYIHDGNGGNNVKTRAERNEIYNNWIEGAAYHELDMIGPDGPNPRRADSDVVGNVLIKRNNVDWFIARMGGDGTGDSKGRFRFVNNTMILGGGTDLALQGQDAIESIEMHNNIFYRVGAQTAVRIFSDRNATWTTGSAIVAGSNNWVTIGSQVPTQWTGTLIGADPLFENFAARDLRPKSGSVVIDKGNETTRSASGHDFPVPLALPLFMPDPALEPVGSASPRPQVGKIDLGALEFGSGPPRTNPENPGEPSGGGGPGTPDGGAGGGGDGDGDGTGNGTGPGNGTGADGGKGGNPNGARPTAGENTGASASDAEANNGCACDLANQQRSSNNAAGMGALGLLLGAGVFARRRVRRLVRNK